MQRIRKWCKENATLSHDANDLIIGKYGLYAFRVFIKEGWAGVKNIDTLSWNKCKQANSLEEFLKLLGVE